MCVHDTTETTPFGMVLVLVLLCGARETSTRKVHERQPHSFIWIFPFHVFLLFSSPFASWIIYESITSNFTTQRTNKCQKTNNDSNGWTVCLWYETKRVAVKSQFQRFIKISCHTICSVHNPNREKSQLKQTTEKSEIVYGSRDKSKSCNWLTFDFWQHRHHAMWYRCLCPYCRPFGVRSTCPLLTYRPHPICHAPAFRWCRRLSLATLRCPHH